MYLMILLVKLLLLILLLGIAKLNRKGSFSKDIPEKILFARPIEGSGFNFIIFLLRNYNNR